MKGEVVIRFDYEMELPPDLTEWNSENKGAEVFEIEYEPSPETLDYYEEANVT